MAFLYILQSETTGRFYIGSAPELERRVTEHLRGHCLATRNRGPWKLVHQERFDTLLEARRRELEIKRWKSANMVRALVESSVGWSGPTGSARSAVRVPTSLPFQVATSFSTCDFLPVFAVFQIGGTAPICCSSPSISGWPCSSTNCPPDKRKPGHKSDSFYQLMESDSYSFCFLVRFTSCRSSG